MTLLETCTTLALTGVVAATSVAGASPLLCATETTAARAVLTDALLEARRAAYTSDAAASVEVSPGAAELVLKPSGKRRALGRGVSIVSGPADASVDFHAGGQADNATVTLACGASSATVVINQRGVVR